MSLRRLAGLRRRACPLVPYGREHEREQAARERRARSQRLHTAALVYALVVAAILWTVDFGNFSNLAGALVFFLALPLIADRVQSPNGEQA